MIKMYKKIIIFFCLISALMLPQMVLASVGVDSYSGEEYTSTGKSNPALNELTDVAINKGPFQEANLLDVVGAVVGVALGLVGTVFLILMIYAGYNWMTAQGEEEKVTKAKAIIIQSIIGIIIVVGAYAVWRFVFSRLF